MADMFKLQTQIRNNSIGIQDYLQELNEWTDSIENKDRTI